jgi:Zinc finger C-x8-C-x5-C-x3-H type (and similar)
MIKKSALSVRSRAFVVSNKNNAQPSKKDRQSCDDIAQAAEKSMVICDYAAKNATKNYLTTSSNCSDEDCMSDVSCKSISTNESLRNTDHMHFGVESSDDAGSGRANDGTADGHVYNILDQKPPIRNVQSHTSESIAENIAAMSAAAGCKPDQTVCDGTQPDKKKTRRAGRRHKAHNKQTFEDGSNPGKEQVKYKTELCKNWLEKGKCSYSVRCRFAHGPHELVQPQAERVVDDYKSKP